MALWRTLESDMKITHSRDSLYIALLLLPLQLIAPILSKLNSKIVRISNRINIFISAKYLLLHYYLLIIYHLILLVVSS